jgi:predicted peroxiredoxin
MNKLFRKLAVLSAAISLLWTFSFPAEAQSQSNDKDGVFIHITHGAEGAHYLLMGLQMAVTMAEDGKDVLVYCDIDAVKVLPKSAEPIRFEQFKSSDELLNRLSELKVQVLACPTCMEIAHIDSTDLRPGVSVASKDLFFSFTQGRILSLDY